MNRGQFLNELYRRLRGLPYTEIDNAMKYYEEYFAEAGAENEAQVIEELGSPEQVANKIIGEYAINDASAPGKKKRGMKIIWIALIALCASPVALPLAIVAVVLIATVLTVMFAVLISLAAAGVSIVGAGLVSIGIGIAVIAASLATGLYFWGAGLVGLSIGVLMLYMMVKLFAATIKGIQKLVGRMLIRRSRNENMA